MAGPGGGALETLSAAGTAVIENEWIFPYVRLSLTRKIQITVGKNNGNFYVSSDLTLTLIAADNKN